MPLCKKGDPTVCANYRTISLIRSLYKSQKSNVRLHGEASDWFQAMQGVRQGCILSPYLFDLMAKLLMRMALGVMKVVSELVEDALQISAMRMISYS